MKVPVFPKSLQLVLWPSDYLTDLIDEPCQEAPVFTTQATRPRSDTVN